MTKLRTILEPVGYILGAHLSFVLYGILQETLFNYEYTNIASGVTQKFTYSQAVTLFPAFFCYIVGTMKNNRQQKTQSKLPAKQRLILGSLFYLMQYTIGTALVYISYPTQLIFTNLKLMSIYFVESVFSRIPQRVKKSEKSKILVGILITIGIFFYSYQKIINKAETGEYYGVGILLIVISLISQGFLVDSQSYVKMKYQPTSNDLFTETNKVTFIIALIMSICKGQIDQIVNFMIMHPRILTHMFLFCAFGTIGQTCLYVLITKFKPSICALCAILRKVLTMSISIIIFGHTTSMIQVTGIVIVFTAIFYQFYKQFNTPQQQSKTNHSKILKQ